MRIHKPWSITSLIKHPFTIPKQATKLKLYFFRFRLRGIFRIFVNWPFKSMIAASKIQLSILYIIIGFDNCVGICNIAPSHFFSLAQTIY